MPTRAEYAKINIACKELAMDKSSLIMDRYQVESSRDLTAKQVADLLVFFRGKGWKPRKGKGRAGKDDFIEIKPGPMAQMQCKVAAMWNALGYPMDKLHVRCKKQFMVDRFEWVTDYNDLHVLITDLTARGRRAGIEV